VQELEGKNGKVKKTAEREREGEREQGGREEGKLLAQIE